MLCFRLYAVNRQLFFMLSQYLRQIRFIIVVADMIAAREMYGRSGGGT